MYFLLIYCIFYMPSDEYEMPPPPPKKRKTVSSKNMDAQSEKEVMKPSAPPKEQTPLPNILKILQKGLMAKAPIILTTPSSSEEHVSDLAFFLFLHISRSIQGLDSPRADV